MEFVLRLLGMLLNLLALIVNGILNLFPQQKPTYPPIRNKLLLRPIHELVIELRQKKLTSVELTQAYIDRLKEVNPSLNAIIEERYAAAIKEAEHADQLIGQAKAEQMVPLFARYPLLGIPFTVKESCGIKDMTFCIGNMVRKHSKCPQNGEVLDLLRAAGCIPLLISANPEFCLSFETNTIINGRCRNPYDLKRTSAGSSGGEGALNGAGASLFGLASDIGGSIRLPALFCGVFGHKPTAGLTSTRGHFPYSTHDKFQEMLVLGPITRFARDLPMLLQIMAGNKAEKLRFGESVQLKDIRVFYSYGYSGLASITQPLMSHEMKLAVTRAAKCFEKGGLHTEQVRLNFLKNCFEVCLSNLCSIEGIPSVMTQSAKTRPSLKVLIMEFMRSVIGHSLFTKEAIFNEIMHRIHAFIPEKNLQKYIDETDDIRTELKKMLGNNGVLLLPSFHTTAFHFNTSIINLGGIPMQLLFNVLGFPVTQVPMGLDERGLPVGIQVVAAPYQDKLCLQIAAELEGAFGGWVPPLENEV